MSVLHHNLTFSASTLYFDSDTPCFCYQPSFMKLIWVWLGLWKIIFGDTGSRYLLCGAIPVQYMLSSYVCVHLSHAGIVSQWLNIESQKQCHTDSSFLMPKLYMKFKWGQPSGSTKQMGKLKRQLLTYNSL